MGVPGRGCRAEVPAERAAVADLRRAHGPRGHGEAGQRAGQFGDQPGIGHAGSHPEEAPGPPAAAGLAGLPDRLPAGQLVHARQAGQRRGPVPPDVHLHHDVRAARDGHGAGPGLHHLKGPGEGARLEEIHRASG